MTKFSVEFFPVRLRNISALDAFPRDLPLLIRGLISAWFRDRSSGSITPLEIERPFEQCIEEEQWAHSMTNQNRSLLLLT
ncbi:MAG TPA: hypothetical protein VNI36_05945 [Candidatus Dormibacteraeota bacterium]|nr:hypothetical protein [Candidatus Dormibacteraeota bacterium]